MMNQAQSKWLQLCVAVSYFLSTSLFAASSAEDVFDPVNEKTEELVDQVVKWGSAICILMIMVVGVMSMLGKFPKELARNVTVGAVIILIGANGANWLLN